jgi:predicted 2-oxoglutarate/Fe(II)-dependent dioxygenase YbiX
MVDYLAIESFLDPEACESLRGELRQAAGTQATVLSTDRDGRVAPQVRRTTRMAIPAAPRERVTELLMERKGELERHFGTALSTCEEPQFLRYLPGDFFVAHQDGNTPLIYDRSRFRKVSAVIFLSPPAQAPAPEGYGGGALVLHGPYSGPPLRVPLMPEPGTLVCFRAETTHEVLPVTHGERFTIVSWFL